MNNFTIYLAGAMTGLSYKAMTNWRIKNQARTIKIFCKEFNCNKSC